jgi:hypothetical protein
MYLSLQREKWSALNQAEKDSCSKLQRVMIVMVSIARCFSSMMVSGLVSVWSGSGFRKSGGGFGVAIVATKYSPVSVGRPSPCATGALACDAATVKYICHDEFRSCNIANWMVK